MVVYPAGVEEHAPSARRKATRRNRCMRRSARPNGPGIELPAALDATGTDRRPPARVAYRCGRPAAGAPPRTPGRRPVSSNALLGSSAAMEKTARNGAAEQQHRAERGKDGDDNRLNSEEEVRVAPQERPEGDEWGNNCE